jgi:hypothetical protein
MKSFIFFSIFFVTVYGYEDQIYCPLCDDGSNHVACGHSGNISEFCPSDAKLVTLTAVDKKAIVDLHNKLRNQIASGKLPGFPSASAMKLVVSKLLFFRLNVTISFDH